MIRTIFATTSPTQPVAGEYVGFLSVYESHPGAISFGVRSEHNETGNGQEYILDEEQAETLAHNILNFLEEKRFARAVKRAIRETKEAADEIFLDGLAELRKGV